jgi:hypothetical protein
MSRGLLAAVPFVSYPRNSVWVCCEADFDPTQIATGHISPGLDEMFSDPVLAAFLSAIDVAAVSRYDRVVVLRAHQRMASHYQAHTYTDMSIITQVLADDGEAGERELASAEIRAALKRAPTSGRLSTIERRPQGHQMCVRSTGAIVLRRFCHQRAELPQRPVHP